MTLLVSKEIEDCIDETQFSGEKDENSIYLLLKAAKLEFVGVLVSLEIHNKINCKFLCRVADLSKIILYKDFIDYVILMENKTELINLDVRNKSIHRFGIYHDNPSDSKIYALDISFE